MDKNNPRKSRRSVLKAAGTSIVGIGMATASVGAVNETNTTELVKQARQIRRETGSQEDYIAFLKKNGVDVREKESTVTYYPQPSEDGSNSNETSGTETQSSPTVQPQEIHEAILTTSFTISDTVLDYHVEIDTTAEWAGEGPQDSIGMGWGEHYNLPENGTGIDNGNNVVLVRSSDDGAHWHFRDGDACGMGCNLWFAVYADLEPTSTYDKRVESRYQSVWYSSSPFGPGSMSVGGDGSISFSAGGTIQNTKQIDRKVIDNPI